MSKPINYILSFWLNRSFDLDASLHTVHLSIGVHDAVMLSFDTSTLAWLPKSDSTQTLNISFVYLMYELHA